jgi:hypothetical protein
MSEKNPVGHLPKAPLCDIPSLDKVYKADIQQMGDRAVRAIDPDSRVRPLEIPRRIETHEDTMRRIKKEMEIRRWTRKQQIQQNGGLDRT